MGFNPVASADDFLGERANPEFLSIATEQAKALQTGALAPDIVAEQQKLARADLLILQFPIWWFGMPAIMKGWADRVFARGFAYIAGHKYDTGLFTGKTAMVAATTGTSIDTYAPDGIDGDILSVLWPVHNGLLRSARSMSGAERRTLATEEHVTLRRFAAEWRANSTPRGPLQGFRAHRGKGLSDSASADHDVGAGEVFRLGCRE
jgi:putative NADPH-quinone reductase